MLVVVDEIIVIETVELTLVAELVCDVVLVVGLEVTDDEIVEDDDAVAVVVEFVMVPVLLLVVDVTK